MTTENSLKEAQVAQRLLARALPFIERLLAAQGDHAEAELVMLQHEMAEVVNPKDASTSLRVVLHGREEGLPANTPKPEHPATF